MANRRKLGRICYLLHVQKMEIARANGFLWYSPRLMFDAIWQCPRKHLAFYIMWTHAHVRWPFIRNRTISTSLLTQMQSIRFILASFGLAQAAGMYDDLTALLSYYF